MKKIISIMLALVLALSMTTIAFATEVGGEETGDNTNVTYEDMSTITLRIGAGCHVRDEHDSSGLCRGRSRRRRSGDGFYFRKAPQTGGGLHDPAESG